RRAAAHRGDGAGHGPAGRGGRPRGGARRQPRAASREPGRLPDGTARAGSGVPRGDRPAFCGGAQTPGAATPQGCPRHRSADDNCRDAVRRDVRPERPVMGAEERMITKPAETEYASFYATYVGQVSPSGPFTALEAQRADFEAFRDLPEDKGNHRYADGKWSVKEVLGHLSDVERVFGYRLLRAARADLTPLPGFDENAWAVSAPHGHRPVGAIVE